jgi:hypothetical protein
MGGRRAPLLQRRAMEQLTAPTLPATAQEIFTAIA